MTKLMSTATWDDALSALSVGVIKYSCREGVTCFQ